MDQRNFFISYSGPDEKWAEWIGFVLEEAGYTVFLQLWDISPGNNFVLKMDEAANSCDRTIMVMSRSYLTSLYAKPEWAQSFAKDPLGSERLVIPVRVESCDFSGILKPVAWINLVDCEESDAIKKLLEGVTVRRNKPLERPVFPGEQREYQILTKPIYPPSEKTFDRRRLPKDEPSSLSIQRGEHFLDALHVFLTAQPSFQAIAFFDIDGQGAINRKFGRHIGDKVIERVFQFLSEETLSNETLHRCGDDTFCVLLPLDATAALKEAARIVELIGRYPWALNVAPNLWVRCSGSAAAFERTERRTEASIHETVLRAAIGCRSARINGGNRAQDPPLALTPDDSVLRKALSKRVNNIHSGGLFDES